MKQKRIQKNTKGERRRETRIMQYSPPPCFTNTVMHCDAPALAAMCIRVPVLFTLLIDHFSPVPMPDPLSPALEPDPLPDSGRGVSCCSCGSDSMIDNNSSTVL